MENKPKYPYEEYPLSPAEPQKMPEPTLWPITGALGTLFIFWGLITSPFISILGLLVLGVTIAGWIQDINHE